MVRLHGTPGWHMYTLSPRRPGWPAYEQKSCSAPGRKFIGHQLFVRTAPRSAGIQEKIPG